MGRGNVSVLSESYFWMLDIGYWLLVTGYWLLDTVYWLLVLTLTHTFTIDHSPLTPHILYTLIA